MAESLKTIFEFNNMYVSNPEDPYAIGLSEKQHLILHNPTLVDGGDGTTHLRLNNASVVGNTLNMYDFEFSVEDGYVLFPPEGRVDFEVFNHKIPYGMRGYTDIVMNDRTIDVGIDDINV